MLIRRPGVVATTLYIVDYTPAMAEAGQFQHMTHVFCVNWEYYESHTMQGCSGIVIQSNL